MTPPASQLDSLSPAKRALYELRSLRAKLEELERGRTEPIAVVGLGLRFPGGVSDADSYWRLLDGGVDAITEIPADRWPIDRFYDSDPDASGRMYTRHGAFLPDVDGFDPDFFGISRREAETLDPQHRLALEVAWEALENSGYNPAGLAGSATGVFLALSNSDYGRMVFAQTGKIDAYASTGNIFSVAAGRISYTLGLAGPSMALDTACSGSLVSVHLACQSLRAGECRMALAGGVNLILSPEININFSKSRMLARDGRCKTFDAAADGYVRGEGCGLVVLKRVSEAVADGDRILALIRGSAVNQDGRSGGLTVPSGAAQQGVIRQALANAQVEPREISYIEAHGTGTALGDPIEAHALVAALGPGRTPDNPLVVGSVKTNIGHLEAAAGVAGLIKVILAFHRQRIPAHLHFQKMNPHIDWKGLPVEIPVAARDWPAGDRKRLAGVSSFGFSGTNAHVILEEPPAVERRVAEHERPLHILALSARSESALAELEARYRKHLEQSHDPIGDLCFTANTGRAHFRHRAVYRVDPDRTLTLLASGSSDRPPEVVFRFSGEAEQQLALWRSWGIEPSTETATAPDGSVCVEIGPAITPRQMIEKLAELYVRGAEVDWAGFDAPYARRRVVLPTYPFERRRYWIETPQPALPDSEREWQSIVESAARQSRQGRLDLDIGSYPERWNCLDRLTTAYTVAALHELGAFRHPGERHTPDMLIEACGISGVYQKLLERWLKRMSPKDLLEPVPAAAILPEAERIFGADRVFLDYVTWCGERLAAILTGRLSPLETLFPGRDFTRAEDLYEHAPLSAYFSGIARAALEAVVRSRRASPLQVLEIGAGTGATSAALLPVLPPDTAYYFTDVSELFLNRAAQKFAAYSFVRYGRLDIERAGSAQGYPEGGFDIIVATNVLHATRNLSSTIANVRSLLAPGGMLILCEATTYLSWFDITTGLIEGWQLFEDGLRGDHPLLAADSWKTVLAAGGFERIQSFPEAGSPAGILGQHVILAQAPGSPGQARGVTDIAAAGGRHVVEPDEGFEDLNRLRELPALERHELVAALVRRHLARVLGLDSPDEVDRKRRLIDLGLDSLMAVELRNRLGRALGLEQPLTATLVFDYPTIDSIAEYLLTEVLRIPEASGPAPDGAAISTRARELEQLPDEEVEAMLLQKLQSLKQ